jgi:hypothetical protein
MVVSEVWCRHVQIATILQYFAVESSARKILPSVTMVGHRYCTHIHLLITYLSNKHHHDIEHQSDINPIATLRKNQHEGDLRNRSPSQPYHSIQLSASNDVCFFVLFASITYLTTSRQSILIIYIIMIAYSSESIHPHK